MLPRSSRFDAAVQDSHRSAFRALVKDGSGNIIYDTDDSRNPFGNIIDGEIAISNDAVRRTGNVSLIGEFTDSQITQLVSETTSWQFWRGIVYPDGTKEMGSLGILYPTNYDFNDSGSAMRHRIELADKSAALGDHRLTKNFAFNGGIVDAVIALITKVDSTVKFDTIVKQFNDVGQKIFIDAETDPWSKSLEMLRDVGLTAYFDANGFCNIVPFGTPYTSVPVWDFSEGVNSTMLNIQRTSGSRKYNHVVVISEGAGNVAPIVAHAYDLNSGSPTYYYGPYGDVPYFIKTPRVKNAIQAQKVADTLLRQMLGRKDVVVISTLVNPFFDIDDVITLTRANTGTTGTYIIDQLSWPLIYTRPMYITMRRGSTL
jgi:hypothetical protein